MPFAPRPRRQPHATPSGKSPAVHERCKEYSRAPWRRLRKVILVRDRMTCQICGKLIVQRGDAHVDHIVPARTISEVCCDPANLRLLCGVCHSRRTAAGSLPGGHANLPGGMGVLPPAVAFGAAN